MVMVGMLFGVAKADQLVFTTTMTGAQEVPPTGSPDIGSALVTIDTVTNLMTVNVAFAGLLSPTTIGPSNSQTATQNSSAEQTINQRPRTRQRFYEQIRVRAADAAKLFSQDYQCRSNTGMKSSVKSLAASVQISSLLDLLRTLRYYGCGDQGKWWSPYSLMQEICAGESGSSVRSP